MTQTVHYNSLINNQNLLATAGFGNNPGKPGAQRGKRVFLTLLGALISVIGMAQTYTTKANGNWNSAATWVNGQVPGTSIAAGKTVIVKHAVTYTQQSDLTIAGTLNIDSANLTFDDNFNKMVTIQSTGVLNIRKGGFLQSVSRKKAEMTINGGRIIMDNSTLTVGKVMKALAGTKRTYKYSTILVGEKYEMEGTSANRSIDTIQFSTLETVEDQGSFDIKDYCSFHVDNAKLIVGKDKLVIKSTSEVKVLPGAAGNYGMKLLKIDTDLENLGAWDARIDAFCIGGNVIGSNYAAVDFTRPEDCNTSVNSAPAPELSFINPVLEKGTPNKEGAEYRFSNITPGIDAVIKLKKFSRSDIKMNTIDNNALGWNKAFQPEFGLPGLVLPFQDWYIDFEMSFYEAGTKKKKKVDKTDFTALDVDGDGYSIAEYAVFNNPASVAFSTASSLSTTPAGSLGALLPCPLCLASSTLIQCNTCQGIGHDANDMDCSTCTGNGVIHSGCRHPFAGIIGNILQGPVQNYNNIDTNGTAVMATYQFQNVDKVTFRYGAKSNAYAVNGSGIRLNSLWSKSFNLSPWETLAVNFADFAVMYENGDANVSWRATNGEELNHFIVQRSTDGKNFTDVATILAGSTPYYSYKDKGISSATGVVYYRVACIDHTDEITFSPVKMIRLAKNDAKALVLTTYPNPVVNDVKITLPGSWQGKPVMLQLYTANGTVAKSIQVGSASQTESMSVGGLTKGLYIVKAICGEESAQQRIIKN